MKCTSAFVAAAVLASVQSVVGLMINTPASLVECQPVRLDWSSDPGTAPYYLSVIPGGQPAAPPLKTFPTIDSATSVTWNVDIQAGTSVTIALKDSTGQTVYTSNLQIQSGSSRSCETSTASDISVASGSGAAPAPAATGGASGAVAPSPSAAPASQAPSGSGSAPSASSSARPSSTQNANVRTSNAAVAGLPTQTFTGVASFFAIVGALVF
ncbi:hypothetical protein NP233_g12038 [Leucocoprinus birnbaumii]|uniref:Ser-Thr-rich glycosyl-phosphatidyl-inositol-anchored membrane family-domain-containing protein n=1 Tax=Leucocoprinus birnbaumii TaxID=56174 RepID=A0AAD5VFD8_9AGAR|nr:hypothetical protein NP233_g12038 [Leucocoprinus birnbaumii]